MTDQRFERAALTLADLGYFVFPVKPHGKEPLTRNGWQDASRDERQILQWWDRWPNANIGVACGPSGIVALDVDSKHGADPREVLPALGFGDYPTVLTGEAGEPDPAHPESLADVRGAHALFRSELATTKTTVKGVELRGVGGYIVVPPSVHPSGVAYEGTLPPVSDLPLAPDTLAGILVANGGGTTIPVPGDDQEVEPGERHEALLAWTRSRLTARGILGRPALDAMLGHNARVMRPSLPDSEVERLWRHLERTRIAESERAVEQALAPYRPDVVFESMSGVRARAVRWLLKPYLPLGKVSLLAGAPGHGKSQYAALLAAMVTRGALWPSDVRGLGHVVMASAEDDATDTILPRLLAVNADVRLVERVIVQRKWGALTAEGLIKLPGDVDALHQRLERGDVRLLIFDPVASFFSGDHSTHSNQDVRDVLDPLKTLAETYSTAVVLIIHLNKQSEVREWSARIAESHGFQAMARSILALGPDPDDPDGAEGAHKVLAISKSNVARKAGTSLRLEIVERTVLGADGEPIETSRLVSHGPCDVSADDLLMGSEQRENYVAASEWLEGYLGDGWRTSKQILAAGQAAGHSRRTIERVRRDICKRTKLRGVKHGGWLVALKTATAPPPTVAVDLGDVGDNEGQDRQDQHHLLDSGVAVLTPSQDRQGGHVVDLDRFHEWEQRKLGERDDDDDD